MTFEPPSTRNCSVCGGTVLVEYGRAYSTDEERNYNGAVRETFYCDADDPSQRHQCDPKDVATRLSRLRYQVALVQYDSLTETVEVVPRAAPPDKPRRSYPAAAARREQSKQPESKPAPGGVALEYERT